ncbi:MAG: hypothetical protein WBN64_08315, partial [Candidatus Deferrimicrobium sp.]
GQDSLPGRISGLRLRSATESSSTPLPGSPRQDVPIGGQPHSAGKPANDNKTPFIKFLDTGFSFGVEDREISFYRVKPLLPERRWAPDTSTAIEGTVFTGFKKR